METHQRLAYLFRRYFGKTCTPAEQQELFELLLRSEHDETLKRLIDETWKNDFPTYPQDKRTADTILRHIISRRESETPSSNDDPGPDFSPSNRSVLRSILFSRWAVAVLGITLLTFLAYYFYRPSHSPAIQALSIAAAKAPAERCITLTDGSKVLLNGDARIEYQKGFNGNTREVTLYGEAYFAIRHDPRPFIVHTGTVRTTVLGTDFNIDAQNTNNIVITVTKGKVKVENKAGQFSILRRNEQIRLDSLQTMLKKVRVDAGSVLAWKKPYLIFNDVTMKEAATELAQRFHASIVFTNPAAENCPVTASFTEGESLEQIIKVLSKINSMEYTIDAGHVKITGEGCK